MAAEFAEAITYGTSCVLGSKAMTLFLPFDSPPVVAEPDFLGNISGIG